MTDMSDAMIWLPVVWMAFQTGYNLGVYRTTKRPR
jgi:hypothetical protein